MKILHILAQMPCGTGSGIYFSNLIKEFKKFGHDQRALFALQDNFEFQHIPGDKQYPVRFKAPNLPFPVPGMSDVMPYESTKYSDLCSEKMGLWRLAFGQALKQAATDFQPQVVILHHLWMLTSLALEFFPEAKSIGICHYTDLRQARLNPSIRENHVNNMHRLDKILSLSDLHQAEIREIHPTCNSEIVTAGGGYDSAIFFPRPDSRPKGPVKILYAGKIDPSKGVFALIRAFLSLREREPDLFLSIVGTANQEQASHLDGMVNGHSAIGLYPAMPQNDLAQTMRDHDIFVMPSFFEGLGLIAVEALASGLRIVATEIEALMSLLGERVLQSGAIEFVARPAVNRAGLPDDFQLGQFTRELEKKLSLQASRVREGQVFPENIYSDISKNSWESIAAEINSIIGEQ